MRTKREAPWSLGMLARYSIFPRPACIFNTCNSGASACTTQITHDGSTLTWMSEGVTSKQTHTVEADSEASQKAFADTSVHGRAGLGEPGITSNVTGYQQVSATGSRLGLLICDCRIRERLELPPYSRHCASCHSDIGHNVT